MKTFKLANTITGWVVFAIAAIVYLMTIEPSASFWDCGEFILSAYKLEVGHPPGAPFFMLVGNLFSQLASSPSTVALMVNAMSAIFSALTILLLFWTITHMGRKLLMPDDNKEGIPLWKTIAVLGAGAVGALAYTFSDTFWYSAVEGEVYAFSSLMTAVVFWLILKWENVADQPHSNRWLILIAYVMGLSIGVHLLNLLCIPAIVMVYYYKKYPNPTAKGMVGALLISFGIIIAILYGLIRGIMEVSGWFELFCVNTLGMSYNSGVFIYLIVVAGVLAWGIWETMREKWNPNRTKIAFLLAICLLGIPFFGGGIWVSLLIIAAMIGVIFGYKKINPVALNSILVGLVVITIGYSSYALIVIRSSANTPMDQNSPEDVFTLRDYLAREQYGDTPLFYGATFASKSANADYQDDKKIYTRVIKKDASEKDRYEVSRYKQKVEFPDKYNMLFPRMYSREDRHIEGYSEWTGRQYRRTGEDRRTGEVKTIYDQPTFGENLKYFFSYQVNFMYWRYFMWNFSGRQNDLQGNGEISKGNWITGIPFLDEMRLGPQDNQPDFIAENKGHNKYYMLPLILGLLGILFQVYSGKRGTQQFWVTFLLFFLTGLAIVVYLNQSPYQPRERDYAYAGSFYAFCIWIGLGTLAVIEGLRKVLKDKPLPAAAIGSALCLCVPIQMASQNWDDHDRSGRYLMRDFGHNYLESCEPNAIIFTYGDNDTFPLWYNQEVEGVRTDVRVCNLSYLNGDWYIDQMKRQAYDSPPLPISWTKAQYQDGKKDVVYILPEHYFPSLRKNPSIKPRTAEKILDWVKSDDPATKEIYLTDSQGNVLIDEKIPNIPTSSILFPLDSVAIMRSGLVDPEYAHLLNEPINIDLSANFKGDERYSGAKTALFKSEVMLLEMLKNNSDWSRPMYFAATVPPDQFVRLDNYLRNEGMALRIMPYQASLVDPINIDGMYDKLMNKFKWGGLEKEGLYIDENSMKMCSSFRNQFAMLASSMLEIGDTIRAKELLDKALKVVPNYNVPYEPLPTSSFARLYEQMGEIDIAKEIYTIIIGKSLGRLDWYYRLNDSQFLSVFNEAVREITYVNELFLPFFNKYDKQLFDQYLEKVKGINVNGVEKALGRLEKYNKLNQKEYIASLSAVDREIQYVYGLYLPFFEKHDKEAHDKYRNELEHYFSRYYQLMNRAR